MQSLRHQSSAPETYYEKNYDSSNEVVFETALLDTRSKFMESKENGALLMSPFYPASFLPSYSPSDAQKGGNGNPKKVARSLFKSTSEPETSSNTESNSNNRLGDALEAKLLNDNEILVNDILHDRDRSLADVLCGINKGSDKIKAQIKSTMEKAFGMVLKSLLCMIVLITIGLLDS